MKNQHTSNHTNQINHNKSGVQTMVKGYKKTDWGVIPNDWKIFSLAELVEKERPISYGIVQTGESKLNGVKCIRVVDLIDGFIDGSNLITTSQEISNSYKRTILRKGDLVIALRGKIGEVAYVDQSLEGANLTRGVAILATKDQFYSSFVKQQLNSKHQKNIFENNLNGSALKELALSVLRKIEIAVPPTTDEQNKIATALSDTDALISSIEKLIAKKRLIKQGAMQKLLTPKEDWEVKKLGDILDYEQPTNYLVKDDKYIETSNIPVLTAGKTFILGYTSETDGIFTNLPVIIFDDFTTASKFVDFPFKAKSSAMKMLIPKDKKVNLKFMFEIMQRINYPVADHQRHWIGVFHKMEISVPILSEQNRISTILSDMDSEIEALETKHAKYKQIKQGMMQNLLTGKIRLA